MVPPHPAHMEQSICARGTIQKNTYPAIWLSIEQSYMCQKYSSLNQVTYSCNQSDQAAPVLVALRFPLRQTYDPAGYPAALAGCSHEQQVHPTYAWKLQPHEGAHLLPAAPSDPPQVQYLTVQLSRATAMLPPGSKPPQQLTLHWYPSSWSFSWS